MLRLRHLGLCALLAGSVAACSGDDAQAPEAVVSTDAAKTDAKVGDMKDSKVNDMKGNLPTTPASTPTDKPASTPVASTPASSNVGGSTLYVNTNGLSVRSGPGMSHKVVKVLKFNSKVTEQSRTKGWVKISNGQFASARFLSSAPVSKPKDPGVTKKVESKPAPAAAKPEVKADDKAKN